MHKHMQHLKEIQLKPTDIPSEPSQNGCHQET